MPYNFYQTLCHYPTPKELKARHKKQITDNIKKDRFKYASR
jgi:hypothetical protein